MHFVLQYMYVVISEWLVSLQGLLFLLYRRPLIAFVEKQLIEKHVHAVLQKGEVLLRLKDVKQENVRRVFTLITLPIPVRVLCSQCSLHRARSGPAARREPEARPAAALPASVPGQGRPQRNQLGLCCLYQSRPKFC